MTDLEQGLPGYERLELPPDPELADTQDWDAGQWQTDFEASLEAVTLFLRIRDPVAILARTASRFILTNPRIERPEAPKQVEVELTQILMLLNRHRPSANPVSPNNLARYWRLVRRHLRGFMNKQPNTGNESDIERFVSRRARLFTLYYRNIFSREDCEHALNGILRQVDSPSEAALGYRLSDLFRAAIRMMDLVQERFKIFTERLHNLLDTKRRSELVECIDSSVPHIRSQTAYGEIARTGGSIWRISGWLHFKCRSSRTPGSTHFHEQISTPPFPHQSSTRFTA
ncbi:hypothetical protein [Bradyrhizobium shewense]|uniref:hypothetical protein n=1 Tax=Bradyrhizobium shewense TaxID=1761772 RepID=UPI000AB53127|nr:hypothetical protein [Bradyrhizobium shewense]